ncbi:hypothetical protein NHX12_007345, partial [Muraenolepis orangiensis]
MAGLSEKERVGCARLLSTMSDTELRGLLDTVTNKMIQYLAMEGVAVPPSSEKHQLVKTTVELWSTGKELSHQAPLPERGIQSTEINADTLGQEFCRWFFELLNSRNPSLVQTPQDWGPQHFWTDAKLNLISNAVGELQQQYEGAQLVSTRLLALAEGERLILSPNLGSHGLRVLSSPHGLVLVAVAGTIHREASFLGIFEQVFGLIWSPTDNTWKIKFIDLKGAARDVVSVCWLARAGKSGRFGRESAGDCQTL